MLSKRSTFRASVLALLLLCGPLRAAELGEVKVNSHIGQQLSADIELVDLTQADLSGLQARLANPDVFKGAGLEMPPELGGLHIAIARREDKRFLHLTTLQPVKAEVLHLFLELSSGGRQIIRAASLWLTPEPPAQHTAPVAEAPAPVAATAPAASAAPAAVVPPAPAQASGEEGLNEAARRAFAYRRQKALEQAQARAAAQEAPPAAPSTAPAPVPVHAAVLAASASSSVRHMPAPGPSCAPARQVEAQLQQCQAMSSKLADIEGKVRRLETALAAPATAAIAKASAPALPPPAPKMEAVAAKPSSAPAKPGATPVKPGVAADLAGNPRKRLMMIGAGALAGLAALGGAIFLMRKRKAKGPLKIWQSFRRKGAAPVDQPAPEEAEQQLAAQ